MLAAYGNAYFLEIFWISSWARIDGTRLRATAQRRPLLQPGGDGLAR